MALCEVALDTGVDMEILEAMLAEFRCLRQHMATTATSHQRMLLLATMGNPILTYALAHQRKRWADGGGGAPDRGGVVVVRGS